MSQFTRVLDQIQQGEEKAADELLPLVYEELRKLAAHKMAGEAPGQTLQPTALVHEAWLRLTGAESKTWTTGGISSPPQPKRCDGFSSSAPAPRADCGEGAELSTFLWNM